MTQPDAPQRTDAAPPFNQPSADLILHTADLVDFRVHSQILAQASPFFASMLALPQPPASPPSSTDAPGADVGPPVVPVSEDSATLELLLRLVYPIPKARRVQMDDPQKMVPALRAAMKYEMELPIEIMTERLAVITPKNPVQVWAAACRTGLEGVARGAAEALKKTWTRPDKLETLAFMDELGDMSGISAGDYFRLKRYLMSEPGSANESLKLLSPESPFPQTFLNRKGKKTKKAGSQFCTDIPGIDVECLSSRGGLARSFGAHQSVLASHSSVWKAKLASLRTQHISTESSVPIVLQLDVDEEPDTLSDLLKICYSTPEIPAGFEAQARLVLAAQKYDIPPHIVAYIRLAWDDAASRNPLEAYFVATNHGLRDYAEAAARKVLAKQTAHLYTSVMEKSPALAYHRMLVYYDASRTMIRDRALQAIAKLPGTISPYDSNYHRYTNISVAPVKTAWEGVIKKEGFGSPGGITQAFQKETPPQYGTTTGTGTVEGFVGAVLHCVLTTQEETERALNDVKITLG
ncbi:hypothetical protein C2E23DRAFT_885382 [Lenzites betulinus]|nr:hypothetical protein C2E23DRAFT_885382 [Lenzites betulinus]